MLKEMNAVLDYVEAHLTEKIDVNEVSQILMLSPYNFQKIFTVLTGISFGDYVRRRRLSSALYDLCETDIKIIDIAGKYGYDSSDAFTKSFKQYFDATPSHIRKTKQQLKAFPKLIISLKIEGGIEMDYQIISKPAFHVTGLSTNFQSIGQGQAQIGGLWATFNDSNDSQQLKYYLTNDSDFQGTVGLCMSSPNNSSYDYVIGVVTDVEKTEKYPVFAVPASKYLVFNVVIENDDVPTSIQKTYKKIFETVLPSSNYQFSGADFEFYPDEEKGKEWTPQIWIPVK